MAMVIATHGFIGSGKSTFARILAGHLRTHWILVNVDAWYLAIYGDTGEIDTDPERERRLKKHVWALWPELIRADVNVILDAGLWRRADRDKARALCQELNSQITIVKFDVTDETALARCKRRNAVRKETEFHIREDAYYRLKDRFQAMTIDEPALLASADPAHTARLLANEFGKN